MSLKDLIKVIKGGKGSGFHGHAGRPGQRGGSATWGVGDTVSFIYSGGDKPVTLTGKVAFLRDSGLTTVDVNGTKYRVGGDKIQVHTAGGGNKKLDAPKIVSRGTKVPNASDVSESEMKKKFSGYRSKLSENENMALLEYSDGLFAPINSKLRGTGHSGDILGYDPEIALEELGGIDKAIGHLDSAISKAPTLDKDINVYRALPRSAIKKGSFKDKGFGSSSINKSSAEEFEFSGTVTAKIIVPKGKKGAFLVPQFEGLSEYEGEFLLPRNTEYEVITDVGGEVVLLVK